MSPGYFRFAHSGPVMPRCPPRRETLQSGSMSEQQPVKPKKPFSDAFVEFIPTGWEDADLSTPDPLPATHHTAARRARLSHRFPGDRLVIPAGGLKVRSNDTDYRFRPHSAFAHLTGLGTDREPDAVLVLEPTDQGHDATLYFKPRAPRTDREFYADARYGEMWVGQRETLEQMGALTQLSVAHIDELKDALAKNAGSVRFRVLRDADPQITSLVDTLRDETTEDADAELASALAELRLCKDEFEAEELREACRRTAEAFEAVVQNLPEAVRRGRGERWVEGVFGLHARHSGNAVGYDTIAAAGDHACTLHWIRNDGDLTGEELLLLDAGIELDSLYTADITRTLPVSGRFTPEQRKVYELVLAAQQAGIDAAVPGAHFLDPHRAAIKVICEGLDAWGILPVSVDEALSDDGGQWRRWMVHGTSHHLGLDVHDCTRARQEYTRDGHLEPGMVITVEPGVYFKQNDLLVPEEMRGIGVRIEDDILITADGNENLSDMLPRDPDAVEAWMADLL